jgi:hypothetical protein
MPSNGNGRKAQQYPENPSGIPMDPGIKLAYEGLFRINPDDCAPIAIRKGLETLEIELEQGRISLEEFLEQGVRVVSIDQFSTREINEASMEASGMPPEAREACEKLYVEFHQFWGVVEYQEKSIGIINRLQFYNGFPRLVNPEELINANSPQEYYAEKMQGMKPEDMLTAPVIYNRVSLAFLKEFLDKNPVYEIEKKEEAEKKKEKKSLKEIIYGLVRRIRKGG